MSKRGIIELGIIFVDHEKKGFCAISLNQIFH